MLTAGGAQFVTPLTLQALSEDRVYTDLFSLTDESEMGHIQLSRSADLVVVAPASADLLARMAAGLANDLAATVLLATDKPVLVAPAMNVRMWLHPATAANLAMLRARGVRVTGPDEGVMACNEFGPGRIAEPPAILDAIRACLAGAPRRTLPAGTCWSPAARPMSRSTRCATSPTAAAAGRATRIAAALAALGARVTLVSGPVALPDPPGVTVPRVETARAHAGGLSGGVAGRCRGVRRCGRRLAGGARGRPEAEKETRRRRPRSFAGTQPRHSGHHCRAGSGPAASGGRVRRRDA